MSCPRVPVEGKPRIAAVSRYQRDICGLKVGVILVWAILALFGIIPCAPLKLNCDVGGDIGVIYILM